MPVEFVIIVGKSCVGKTTLERKLYADGFTPILIATNRPEREDDPNHYICTDLEYLRKLMMSQDEIYHFHSTESTYYVYLDPRDNTNKHTVSFISAVKAREFAASITERYENAKILILEITADENDIAECLKQRGMSDANIKARIEAYEEGDTYFAIPKIDRDEAFEYIVNYFSHTDTEEQLKNIHILFKCGNKTPQPADPP